MEDKTKCPACGVELEDGWGSVYCSECTDLTHFEREILTVLNRIEDRLSDIDMHQT